MIKGFIARVIGVVFLGTMCEMIMPEGTFKKYYKLAMGFIMMCVLIQPLAKKPEGDKLFDFSYNVEISEEELKAKSDAYILKIHEETIKNKLLEICGSDVEIFIELYNNGLVRSVGLRGENVSLDKITEIKTLLGCDNVKVVE